MWKEKEEEERSWIIFSKQKSKFCILLSLERVIWAINSFWIKGELWNLSSQNFPLWET